MVIHDNKPSLHEREQNIFTENLNLSMESRGLSIFKFTNQVMVVVYQLFHNSSLPRVSEDMRNKLQIINDPIGDWFIYKDFTVIRVHGFTKAPYMFPSFLIPRLFSLEFLRQRLFVEQELLLSIRKDPTLNLNILLSPLFLQIMQLCR